MEEHKCSYCDDSSYYKLCIQGVIYHISSSPIQTTENSWFNAWSCIQNQQYVVCKIPSTLAQLPESSLFPTITHDNFTYTVISIITPHHLEDITNTTITEPQILQYFTKLCSLSQTLRNSSLASLICANTLVMPIGNTRPFIGIWKAPIPPAQREEKYADAFILGYALYWLLTGKLLDAIPVDGKLEVRVKNGITRDVSKYLLMLLEGCLQNNISNRLTVYQLNELIKVDIENDVYVEFKWNEVDSHQCINLQKFERKIEFNFRKENFKQNQSFQYQCNDRNIHRNLHISSSVNNSVNALPNKRAGDDDENHSYPIRSQKRVTNVVLEHTLSPYKSKSNSIVPALFSGLFVVLSFVKFAIVSI